ncbi:MAG: pentose kinase, partial [Rhizobiales bacterium]|nr:pentose kinase [Hyphomicrobiales bacterium]
RADIARATIEGIALGLRVALDELRRLTDINPAMTIVGGGARSALMRQAMADLLDCAIVKTSIDQQSASLGAAALAMVATGNWADMQPLLGLHRIEQRHEPDPETADRAARMLAAYRAAAEAQRTLAPLLANLRA